MAGGTFSQQATAWVTATRERMTAVRNEAIQRTLATAQEPGPSVANPGGGQGGHMPVDTGFLRASLVVVKGDMLPASRVKPEGQEAFAYDQAEGTLTLAGAEMTDTITAAWTANYARFAEERYGFSRLAAQQWPRIVAEVASEAYLRGLGA